MTTTLTTATRLPVWARLSGGMQQPLPEGTNVQDALRLRGLTDWQVETMPLITMGHDGTPLDTEKVATVRLLPDGGSAVLGVGLGKDYPVIQNEIALGMDTLLSESGAEVFTAGGMKGGRQVFLSMRLPETVLVGGADPTEMYLNALTSHDGSMALTLLVTPVRIGCTNALPIARLKAASTYKVRHVGDAGLKIAEARAALDLTFAYAEEWRTAMDNLLATEMTNKEFDALVAEQFLPVKEDAKPATLERVAQGRDDLSALFRSADTQDFGRGTRYAAFNALTEWSEWIRPRDAFTESAAASTLTGAGANFREKAFAALSR